MTIQEIIERNYSATVKRGLINPETTEFKFYEKLNEEIKELKHELDWCVSVEDAKIEMADCALVLFAMAKHFNIDLLKAMEEKVIYNEKRTD